MNPIRVLLVDKSPEFLDAATRFLANDPELTVVGQLQSARDLLHHVAAVKPAVVLMDLDMPEINGLVATLHLKALAKPPRIIIVTAHTESPYRTLAKSVSTDGFVAKHDFCAEVVPLIKRLVSTARSASGD